MDTLLLATKLRIPPRRDRLVRRERLLAALERDIRHHKLILLSAPAGYGKTTLLSQWAHESSLPIVWLSISQEDNSIERFLRYLLAGWEELQPGVRESQLGLLLSAMMPDIQAVLAAFINAANDAPGQLVFVLDDYHLIEEPSIHQALTFLIDHMPPTLHFVLAGRADPPLPCARYRARRQLVEFRAEDLQFLQEETAAFLSKMMGLELAHAEVASLQVQLEGWVAGLQLAALSLQRHHMQQDGFVLSGRQRFIVDYLSEDVFAHLDEDTQRFLLQTSLLDRLCSSLCDAVAERNDSQAMLERLERDNLFLVPLDDSRAWFRYHHIFADYLREELSRRYPDQAPLLQRRAARWYLEHDLPDQALQHAVAAGDAEIAVHVFNNYIDAKLNIGELRVVQRWIELLPEQWYSAYPVLGIARAGLLAFTGALDACVRCIDELEQRLQPVVSQRERSQLAKVAAVRCAIACMQDDLTQAETYAGQALHDLSQADEASLHLVYGALGDAYRSKGRWQEAKQHYLKVLDLPQRSVYRFQSVHVFGALADLELRQGRLRAAAAYWRKALAGIQDRATWGELSLPLIGWVYIRMGELLYEWNELAAAQEHLSQGMRRVEIGGDVRAMIAGHLLTARLQLTAGDAVEAGESLERARPLAESAHFMDWTARFHRFQAELRLAQGKLRAAINWTDELLQSGRAEGRPEHESYLALARLLIVRGDAPALDRALEVLAHLLEAADAEGRLGILIEALALQAIGYRQRGDSVAAMTSLERALRLAEPEGYVRLFADLGSPMARLLQEARARDVQRDYSERLLAAFGADLSFPAPAQEDLPEPLTSREQDVLELLAAGLTNREIAEALIISPETVKKHTGNIYSKLSARSRREAVARARDLALLGQSRADQ